MPRKNKEHKKPGLPTELPNEEWYRAMQTEFSRSRSMGKLSKKLFELIQCEKNTFTRDYTEFENSMAFLEVRPNIPEEECLLDILIVTTITKGDILALSDIKENPQLNENYTGAQNFIIQKLIDLNSKKEPVDNWEDNISPEEEAFSDEGTEEEEESVYPNLKFEQMGLEQHKQLHKEEMENKELHLNFNFEDFLNSSPPDTIFGACLSKEVRKCILKTKIVGETFRQISQLNYSDAWEMCDPYFWEYIDERRSFYGRTQGKESPIIRELKAELRQYHNDIHPQHDVSNGISTILLRLSRIENQFTSAGLAAPPNNIQIPVFQSNRPSGSIQQQQAQVAVVQRDRETAMERMQRLLQKNKN